MIANNSKDTSTIWMGVIKRIIAGKSNKNPKSVGMSGSDRNCIFKRFTTLTNIEIRNESHMVSFSSLISDSKSNCIVKMIKIENRVNDSEAVKVASVSKMLRFRTLAVSKKLMTIEDANSLMITWLLGYKFLLTGLGCFCIIYLIHFYIIT